MRAYHYTAFSAEGRRRTGTVLADDESQASRQLKAEGLFVADLRERGGSGARAAGRGFGRRRLNTDMQAVFTRQMAVLLGAGLTSEQALEAVRGAGAGPAMESLAAGAKAGLMDGQPLSDALEASGAGFPPYYVASVRAGERSGDVGAVFQRLADHLERAGRDRARMSTALIYPAFVASVALAVSIILMTTVAPDIVLMFEGSGQPLPALTVAMLTVSNWISANWVGLVAGLVGLTFLYLAAMRVQTFRDMRDTVLLRLPLAGGLIRQGAAVQYLRTLALLLSSRHPVLNAVESAADVLAVSRFRREAIGVADAVRSGARLSEGVRGLSIVPPVVRQLMDAGEKSADLARMTERGAVLVENNLGNARKRIAALLEPALMMVVGAGVLVIVLSVLLPIFDLQLVVTE